jgi:hypothetical protein
MNDQPAGERLFTPADNNGQNIFVFGSNLRGVHGAGAAKEARKFWGAAYGMGIGRTGMAYAIPTKDFRIQTLPISNIRVHVSHFLNYTDAHPELRFLVTKIGCGLAGYREAEISPLFANAPANCVLPNGWRQN